MLQQEFITINEDLKKSLQQRMKFEIAERILSDSKMIFYLRLFIIKNYYRKREYLE